MKSHFIFNFHSNIPFIHEISLYSYSFKRHADACLAVYSLHFKRFISVCNPLNLTKIVGCRTLIQSFENVDELNTSKVFFFHCKFKRNRQQICHMAFVIQSGGFFNKIFFLRPFLKNGHWHSSNCRQQQMQTEENYSIILRRIQY